MSVLGRARQVANTIPSTVDRCSGDVYRDLSKNNLEELPADLFEDASSLVVL